jgi:proline dehydrogenase
VRAFFLYLSRSAWLRRFMEQSSLSLKLTRRFIAGMSLDDELEVCRKLDGEHILSTLDHLGENVSTIEEASNSVIGYLTSLDRIAELKLPSTVSIKLTQFGLDLSKEACLANVTRLVDRARQIGSRVEIDMESSEYTDRTLDIVRELHRYAPGCVRAVIQAYLFRSEADIESLSNSGIRVRLCKGAYQEPASVAYASKTDVDSNYVNLMKVLFDKGTDPAIASHDERIVREALAYTKQGGIGPERFEFQMLYGIRRDLQRQIIDGGYRLRLYVPYGDAWYPYFMRRLAERPANVLFLLRNLIKS